MITAWLGWLAIFALPGSLEPVTVLVEDPTGAAIVAPIQVEVRLTTGEPARPAQAALGHTPTRAGRATFLLSPDHSWTFTCRDALRWCAVREWQTEDAAGLRLVGWPKGSVHGTLRLPEKTAMPSHVLVQGWGAAADGDRSWHLDQRVEVSAEGRFTFEAPSTQMDLRLSAGKPWGPIYRWGQTPRQHQVNLGALNLEAGASVTAFVMDADSGEMVDGAVVTWNPPIETAATHQDHQRLSAMGYEATSDEHGLIQIHGIAPGTYRLTARSEGRGELELGPFQIDDAVELHFEEIRLQSLATVRVRVQPRVDPDLRPWNISMQEDSTAARWHFSTPTIDGEAVLQVPKGRKYAVQLDTESNHGISQKFLEVYGDMDLDLQPGLIAVQGTVRMGDDPLAAKIRIQGGRFSFKSFESDDEGVFEGWMGWDPMTKFFVRIEPLEENYQFQIDLDASDYEEVLDLDLVLPNRSIEGHVLDAQGHPVADARVAAKVPGEQQRNHATSDAKGAYRLGMIPEGGPVELVASNAQGSARVEVADWGEGSGPPTDLKFRSLRQLQGVLSNAARVPLAGARIAVYSGHFSGDRAGADGSFEVRIVPSSRQGALRVSALGYPYWFACLPLPEKGVWNLQHPFQGSGGHLVLDLANFKFPPGSTLYVVTPDGGFASLSSLYQWGLTVEGFADREAVSTGKVVIGAVSPGMYALVVSDREPGTDGTVPCFVNPTVVSDWVRLHEGGETVLRTVAN